RRGDDSAVSRGVIHRDNEQGERTRVVTAIDQRPSALEELLGLSAHSTTSPSSTSRIDTPGTGSAMGDGQRSQRHVIGSPTNHGASGSETEPAVSGDSRGPAEPHAVGQRPEKSAETIGTERSMSARPVRSDSQALGSSVAITTRPSWSAAKSATGPRRSSRTPVPRRSHELSKTMSEGAPSPERSQYDAKDRTRSPIAIESWA